MIVKWIIPATAVLLTACAPTDVTVEKFSSEKDKRCYDKALAEIDNKNITLERDKEGKFVQVTRINGFVRDIDPSITYERCMVSVERHIEAGPEVKDSAISLSAAEKVEWDKLTDGEKRAALVFIQSGGSLTEYLAQR